MRPTMSTYSWCCCLMKSSITVMDLYLISYNAHLQLVLLSAPKGFSRGHILEAPLSHQFLQPLHVTLLPAEKGEKRTISSNIFDEEKE